MTHDAKNSEGGVTLRVKYTAGLRDKTGCAEEEVRLPCGSTLEDLANWLNERYDLSLPNRHILAVLNGRGWNQYAEKLLTELNDGDSVLLCPPISGG